MKNIINNGVYPVMLTPFFEDMSIDYEGVKNFTNWFIEKGSQGLFAVCGSSEMNLLSLEERIKLAKTVVDAVGDRTVDVVASGHISPTIEGQIEEINEISKTGIASFVLVSGRVALKHQDDTVFLNNIDKILANTGDTTFGIYECPSPYNRQLTPVVMKYLADTKRFTFSKDTSCSYDIVDKIIPTVGSSFKVFNAFSSLCLESMKAGGKGYSGIHANYFPDIYVKLWETFEKGDMKKAQMIQSFITTLSLTSIPYNIGTKYYLNKFENVKMAEFSRSDNKVLSDVEKYEISNYFETITNIRAIIK